MPERFTPSDLDKLIHTLSAVHDGCLKTERTLSGEVEKVAKAYGPSARNLLHYLGLRQFDLREFQQELASFGLSSLGRTEAHTLAGLDAVLAALYRLARRKRIRAPEALPPVDFKTGPALLAAHTEALLGPEPAGRRVRIMVTMPSEAAAEYKLVRQLLEAGMDVMRINCAHDDVPAWQSMVRNLRRAEKEVGRPCRVLIDLAGPKLRTGPIQASSQVVHWKPARDVRGTVISPALVWLTADGSRPPSSEYAVLPADPALLKRARKGDTIAVKDTHGKLRVLEIDSKSRKGLAASAVHGAFIEKGSVLQLRRSGHKVMESRVGGIAPVEEPLILRAGNRFILTAEDRPGEPPKLNAAGKVKTPAHIPCTLPEVFGDVRAGERIFFDDGKIEGVIKRAGRRQLDIVILDASENGSKLRSDKGINLPDTRMNLPALTGKDLLDLQFVVKHADIVGMSFVRRPEDVCLLAKRIEELGATGIGVILKIETRAAFEQLPMLLLAGLQSPPLGVMVARGDLAVEVGFERLAELQEEMLWLCEAAHVPIVWATQVLENMAQTGKPSRAEVSDAAMSARAECVMLNKGPHVAEAVRFLDNVLHRMQRHQQKKRSMLRKLSVSQVEPPETVRRRTGPGLLERRIEPTARSTP